MVKQYVLVSNEQRKRLLELIYQHSYSISRAAQELKIYYPTAKAINKVYKRERRILKKTYRTTGLKDEGEESQDEPLNSANQKPRQLKVKKPADQTVSADSVNCAAMPKEAVSPPISPVCKLEMSSADKNKPAVTS